MKHSPFVTGCTNFVQKGFKRVGKAFFLSHIVMKPVITNNLNSWAHLVTVLMKFGTETNDFSKVSGVDGK